MPLDDLSDVSRTLGRLLRLNIARLDDTISPMVTFEPPEVIERNQGNPDATLSVHLYHAVEDAHYKNLPGAGSDPPNVAKNPMGLCLYYIVTAHHRPDDAENASDNLLFQQRLMGYALKTLHDFPVIKDTTRAGDPSKLIWTDAEGAKLGHLQGGQNHFEIILRPLTPEDAMSFWGTEERTAIRFSAYYEVRVLFLEPERPSRIPGTVLKLGQFVFQLGAPTLEKSQSQIRFTMPGPGERAQTPGVSPARVTLNSTLERPPTPADPDPPRRPKEHNRLDLIGTNLSKGKSQTLLLSTALWDAEYPVDLIANPSWSVAFGRERVEVTLNPNPVPPKVELQTGDGSRPVRPGIYTARVSAVVDEEIVGGDLEQLPVSSNATAFAVAPRIVGFPEAPVIGDAGLIRIIIGAEFSVEDTALDDAIEVIIDGAPYLRVPDTTGPGSKQQFSVRDDPGEPATARNAIRLNPHFDVTDTGIHPFRLIVNGAESDPFWIVTPL